MSQSVVYLVGAGPGHPGLITVRGLECLASADVVLYDHLVHPRLLRHARADAEKIDVGIAAPQPVDQEAICYLLAEKAREGKVVARLKWGDPFIFDYGGTEALFLHEQGVPFEVVPGIPAGIGAASYAGVPLTYPGGGDTLTFVRGHEDEGRGARRSTGAAWRGWTAPSSATRDRNSSPHAAGAGRPRAVAGRFGGADLRRHAPDAADDARNARRDRADGQGVRAIGGRRYSSSAASRRCASTCAGSTRGRCSGSACSSRVRASRPPRWSSSSKRAAPKRSRRHSSGSRRPTTTAPLDAACAAIRQVRLDRLRQRERGGRLHQAPAGDAAGSPGAERREPERRRPGDGRAPRPGRVEGRCRAGRVPRRSASSKGSPASRDITGLRILLPRADIGREVVAEELRRRGADVTEVVAYRTLIVDPEREGEPDIYRMLLDRRIDVVTFTSASAVRSLVRVLGAEPAADLLQLDGGRVHWSGDSRGRGAVQHREHDRADGVHRSGTGGRHRRAFRATIAFTVTRSVRP